MAFSNQFFDVNYILAATTINVTFFILQTDNYNVWSSLFIFDDNYNVLSKEFELSQLLLLLLKFKLQLAVHFMSLDRCKLIFLIFQSQRSWKCLLNHLLCFVPTWPIPCNFSWKYGLTPDATGFRFIFIGVLCFMSHRIWDAERNNWHFLISLGIYFIETINVFQ